jgi:predicted O-methyltransferase YrrM
LERTLMPQRRETKPHDPFRAIYDETNAHRLRHGCGAYPFGDANSLGVLAAATRAKRILELGTALGYTACWFAYGAPDAIVDTIERDRDHVRLSCKHIEAAGFKDRVRVHEGEFAAVLPAFESGYDIVFFDGYAPTLEVMKRLRDLLRTGGLMISANLDLSGGDGAAHRAALCEPKNWMTSFMAEQGRTAVSVKR